MEQSQITESKKRTIRDVAAQELSWKFKIKQDLITFMDKQ